MDAERPVLLLPAKLVEKTNRERIELSKHWRIPLNIRLVSMESLGRVQSATLLETWRPDVIGIDEAHMLKNPKAAVTRRYCRYLADHPNTKVFALSGTMCKHSMEDYAHLAVHTLKSNVPLPTHKGELMEWAEVLDEKTSLGRVHPGALLDLCNAEERKESAFRAARLGYQRRLLETPGVVSSRGAEVGASLYINEVTYQVNQVTEDNFRKLRTSWLTPDDWPLVQAVDVWRHARELALGFHYSWFREQEFKSWIEKQKDKPTETIERRILSACVNTTGIGLLVARALARSKLSGASGRSTGTELLSRSTRGFSRSSTESATSAASEVTGSDDLPLITVIEREGFEACCARLAIEPLELWTTLLRASPELSSICARAIEAARPPPEWMNRRSSWAKFVRQTLARSRHLDSPHQVELAVLAGEIEDTLVYEAEGKWCKEPNLLRNWKDIEGTFKPNTVPVWHDDSALKFCEAWGKKQNGIIWTDHSYFGRELSRRTGWDYFGREGLNAAGVPIDLAKASHEGKTIIASRKSNGTGRNLQAWNKSLVVSIPGGADEFEQMVARTHRPGQDADEVTVDVVFACAEHMSAWQSALAGAQMVQDTLGQQQKILKATVQVDMSRMSSTMGSVRWTKTLSEKDAGFVLPII